MIKLAMPQAKIERDRKIQFQGSDVVNIWYRDIFSQTKNLRIIHKEQK